MARSRRRNRPEPSLFPFLSILACVIGALALLITSQAVGQVAGEAVDVERYEQLEARIAADRVALAELTAMASEVEGLDGQLAAAREEAASLAEQVGGDPAAITALRERLAEVGSHNSALARELELLAKGARERASKLDARRGNARAPVRVRPSGSGRGLKPYFVECRREGLRLYTAVGVLDVPGHLISTSAAYRNFVRGVAQRRDATVIFLIRPGGVARHEIALRSIRQSAVRTAEIPIPGDGELDLSAFDGLGGDS